MIVRNNIGPVRILERRLVTTRNDTVNTVQTNGFRSIFTHEQLNITPLDQHNGNTFDNFYFSFEEVQEPLHQNICKSTIANLLHLLIIHLH